MMSQSQLVWRCRRGVRELDVLLTRFLESDYSALDEQEKLAFERLLEVQDPVIMDWLFSKAVSEDVDIAKLIIRLQKLSGLNS